MNKNPTKEQLNVLFQHYQSKRFDKAENLAKSITREFPNHYFGWKILGVILKDIGKINEALDAMKKSVELEPKDPESYNNLGVVQKELGKFNEAKKSFTQTIILNPNDAEAYSNLSLVDREMGRLEEAKNNCLKAISLKPDLAEAHNNLALILERLGNKKEAEASYLKAISLKPDLAEAHNNLGAVFEDKGKLEEAKGWYQQAILLDPNYYIAINNIGNIYKKLGRLKEARDNFKKAIELQPSYIDALWNLSASESKIDNSEYWLDEILKIKENHLPSILMKAALRFYKGDKNYYNSLQLSEYSEHAYMRSFSWVFSLQNLPKLYFNKWHFFDAIFKKTVTSKPFYEFGVWNGASFQYLIKNYKKGYGFDTFQGLPEDWHVGSKVEKKGKYSSEGSIPKIKGAEFIEGKFEDTLPVFFSENRPIASLINFDADLYSSTICALNFTKKIIDKDTILIFDELIMNESWEEDEFKALNEFCSINQLEYEVIAVSFFSKQVAVKLIGI